MRTLTTGLGNTLGRTARRAFRAIFPRKWHALHGMDKKLLKYLPRKGGFFVELGASDGVSQSNTYYLERYRGWRGILIEPIPWLCQKCRQNRPNSEVLNYACVAFDYPHDHVEMVYCGLMSIIKGARGTSTEDAEHIEAGAKCQGLEPREVSVPAATLTSLLDQCCTPRIDLLSLDVEGFELQVLKGLDMNKYRPEYVLIELNFREQVQDYACRWYEVVDEFSERDVLFRAKH